MDAIISCMLESVPRCFATSETWNENEYALFLRNTNAEINELLHTEAPIQNNLPDYEKAMTRMFDAFAWCLPCCSNEVHVDEMYNGTHISAMVFAKCVYIVLEDTDANVVQCTPQTILPDLPVFHITSTPFCDFVYTDFRKLIEALQARLHVMLEASDARTSCTYLVMCWYVFGKYVSLPAFTIHQLDDPTVREPLGPNASEFRVNKKSIRACANVLLSLTRDVLLFYHATLVHCEATSQDTYARIVTSISNNMGKKKTTHLHHEMAQHVAKVRRLQTQQASVRSAVVAQDPEILWSCVSKLLGSDAVGLKPRTIAPKLMSLLADISIVCVHDLALSTDCTTVSDAFCRVVVCALEQYYIVPSASSYRTVQNLETLLPGQRLVYTYDFMQFDTGQLTQVIYFHNPVATQLSAPVNLKSWIPTSAAGPVGAFMQLDRTLQIHASDIQDPLGIRRETHVISRPAEVHHDANSVVALPELHDFSFIVGSGCTYLVRRSDGRCFRLGNTDAVEHPYVALVCLYCRLNNTARSICAIALNSVKLLTSA
jgi:hypothetical protein